MAASMRTALLLQRLQYAISVSAQTRITTDFQKRCISKHFHPDWKRQRREKFMKVNMIDPGALRELQKDRTPAQVRALMKKKGLVTYRRAPYTVDLSTSGILYDEYEPTEFDRPISSLTEKAKAKGFAVRQRLTTLNAHRKMAVVDSTYDRKTFPEKALELYIDAHKLLQKVFPRNSLHKHKDDTEYFDLHDHVTEYAWPEMTKGLSDKTLKWKFVESIEPPRIAHASKFKHHNGDAEYGQVTLRFHHKQIMAIYDRFGRLMYGSPTVPRDVLEFIVFEKFLTDDNGKWRIHGRIMPSWYKVEDDVPRTVALQLDDDDGGRVIDNNNFN